MQHSTLFVALKEAFFELSAAQPGFFRYPGRGNWFGDGACGRGDAGIEVCARQVAFRPGDHVQDAARRVGPSTPAHRFGRQDTGGPQVLQAPGRGRARDAMDS